ncbi:guanine deaminase [Ureibacillus sp. 179-F W5.1 NHS]|uniref:Guanine deaminase n=1 Tax=Lysinibacillus halotolerans TaxID=1368476 RepID=A0A3M8H974_9BACI|nr:guanine deaminase [Lysinibacillus halotolerans]RNC98640.1 guanine deaminase [Lysinibacillus halotolerans]
MGNYAHVFQGTAFTSKTFEEVGILKDYLFCINEKGMIVKTVSPEEEQYVTLLREYEGKDNFHRLLDGEYILPGFIDLHVHAPQWAQAGTALDLPLYDWLNTYTFPIESKFSDINFAQSVYEDLVQTLLANGTTTALYFASIHKESSLLLAQICARLGQRGLVGKVVMDNPDQCPEYYRDESTEIALKETEEFIIAVQELNEQTKQGVYPVVTPRFIPSCTDEALKGLGVLAAKYNTHIQSHCSESDWQHGYAIERFHKHDAFALNDFGLLQEKAVMAHCNFLADKDAKLFASTGTAVAHCPISNVFFSNGVLPARHLHDLGIEIGLGTDISGGFSPSLFDNVRQAVIAARMLEEGVDTTISADKRGVSSSRITTSEAFYFATAGGGEALSLPVGRIEENYAWDVQIINTTLPSAKLPIFNNDLEDIFQKIMYLARPENIQQVWVQGEKVHER